MMESRFTYEDNPRLIIWEVDGIVTVEELLKDYTEHLQHPQWSPDLNVLVSFTENSELHKLNRDNLTWFAEASDKLDQVVRQGKAIRTAIICHSQIQAPIIQLWQYMVEEQLLTNDRYFDDEVEARAWLTGTPIQASA